MSKGGIIILNLLKITNKVGRSMRKKNPSLIICIILFFICGMCVIYNMKENKLFNTFIILSNSRETNVKDYKSFYNTVKEAMLNYESTLTIYVSSYDTNIYNLDIVKKILKDNPELQGNFAKDNLRVEKTIFSARLTFTFHYFESKTVIENRDKAVNEKVKEIVSRVIKKDMKDYEKEAALHDYVVNNTKYDTRFDSGNMPKESYTAYGVLIKGVGVCQGYAQAMDRLLSACGIENMMVTGEANNGKGWIGHAWNIVKIGGQYYQLDTTWDDPITEDGSNRLRYTYFNLTDEEIGKSHKWNKNDYPACDNNDYSFKNLNLPEKDSNGKAIVKTKNYKEFYTAVKKSLTNKETSVTYEIMDYDDHAENIKYWIESAFKDLNKSGMYKVTYYKDDVQGSAYAMVEFMY